MAEMTGKIKTIGILTGGGDCPGLNAVIRAVVKTAIFMTTRLSGFVTGGKALLMER